MGDLVGVPLGDVVPKRAVEFEELAAKRYAIDAYNALYQFLAVIRQPDGTPLMDRHGRVTSHLSGLFYRTIKLLELGLKPVYVFDGEPPELKRRTIERRIEVKEEARRKWEEAVRRGALEEARKYAQAVVYLQPDMVNDSKKLLEAMGVPYVQAPSEGEAQAAYMASKGDVWAAASQDYDSLLFGAPRLVRNLTITGKRKLPNKNIYVEIKPELILLDEVLKTLGLTRRKLIWMCILLGTDYNEKVPGVGPKRALELVKTSSDFDEILRRVGYKPDWDWREIEEIFLHPKVTDDYDVRFKRPDKEKIFRILVDKHDFSPERVEKAYERLIAVHPAQGEQTSLDAWFS